MALPLTLVFVSALLIFKAGAFPPMDNGNSNSRNFVIFSFFGHKLTMFLGFFQRLPWLSNVRIWLAQPPISACAKAVCAWSKANVLKTNWRPRRAYAAKRTRNAATHVITINPHGPNFFVSFYNLIIAISFLRDTNNNTIISFWFLIFLGFGCWCVPSSARYDRRLPGTRRNVQVGKTFWPLFLVVVFSAIRIETNSMMNRR